MGVILSDTRFGGLVACFETFVALKRKIDLSNYDSANLNGNLYIVQEQASIEEIYEQYPCPCSVYCACKRHGCDRHWRLRAGVSFDQFRDAYLRMFVHRYFHRHVLECLTGGAAPAGRAGKPVPFLLAAQSSWNSLSVEAHATGATLLCESWRTPFWVDHWSVWHDSVYWAKVWAMLLPDIAVPYDRASLAKLRACTHNAPPPYVEMLARVRDELIALLSRELRTVKELRKLDDPAASGAVFDHARISLRGPGFVYGKSFGPEERPLSRVIDKCFYSPAQAKLKPLSVASVSGNTRAYRPLSDKGNDVLVSDARDGVRFVWGNAKGVLTDADIELLLAFFPPGCWKRLGASRTDPPRDGFGVYLQTTFPRFTSGHASAVAAILVSEGWLDFKKDGNAILLRRVDND